MSKCERVRLHRTMFQIEKTSVEQILRARDVLTMKTREDSTNGLLRGNHTEAARLATIFQQVVETATHIRT